MNASFGLLDPAPAEVRKQERKAWYARRALAEMERLEALEPVPAAAPAPARAAADHHRP
jgi:hypothetical protein